MGRYLSQSHLDAYKNGIFKKLLMAVKEDPELSFEIRQHNEAVIYYRKDRLLSTAYWSDSRFKVSLLDPKYYAGAHDSLPDIPDALGMLDSIARIRQYFSVAKRLAYFYKMGTEFAAQQSIALGNHSFENRFIAVDMEWQFSQAEIPESKRIPQTRIDLVMVDTMINSEGENDIYLAELKVGMGATEGKSGVLDHVDKTFEIITCPEAREALAADVNTIISQKETLGLIDGSHRDLRFAPIPKMMIIAYSRGTDEALRLNRICRSAIAYADRKYNLVPLLLEVDGRITL